MATLNVRRWNTNFDPRHTLACETIHVFRREEMLGQPGDTILALCNSSICELWDIVPGLIMTTYFRKPILEHTLYLKLKDANGPSSKTNRKVPRVWEFVLNTIGPYRKNSHQVWRRIIVPSQSSGISFRSSPLSAFKECCVATWNMAQLKSTLSRRLFATKPNT